MTTVPITIPESVPIKSPIGSTAAPATIGEKRLMVKARNTDMRNPMATRNANDIAYLFSTRAKRLAGGSGVGIRVVLGASPPCERIG